MIRDRLQACFINTREWVEIVVMLTINTEHCHFIDLRLSLMSIAHECECHNVLA
jgi:hypothetical protein